MPAPSPFALTVADLVQRFDGRTVLRLDAWSVAPAQHSLVLGASGSGKSTLLHLIAGLLSPSQGRIAVNGQNLADISARRLDAFRARHLGIVPQNLHLITALSVRDNLRLAQSLAGRAVEQDWIMELLDQVGLAGLARQKPDMLSHGERQRAAIARALVNHPALLLADEPTAALDDGNAHKVMELLLRQATRSGTTLVVATHDQRITAYFAERLVLEAQA